MTIKFVTKETIEVQRIICIIVIDHCHGIPFHSMLFQQVNPFHYLIERRLSHLVLPVFIVKFLRTVYRNAYQKIILAEEFTPFICQQCAICLNAIINGSTTCIFFLKFQGFLIKTKGRIKVSPPCQVNKTCGMVCD